jgi:hypothetical protein
MKRKGLSEAIHNIHMLTCDSKSGERFWTKGTASAVPHSTRSDEGFSP